MKKTLLFAAAVLGLSAVSCVKDDDPQITETTYYDTYSLAIPVAGTPVVSPTKYVFTIDGVASTGRMSTDNLVLGGGNVGFTTKPMPYKVGLYNVHGKPMAFGFLEGTNIAASGDKEITNYRCQMTNASNTNSDSLLNKLTDVLKANPLSRPSTSKVSTYLSMQYYYGTEWKVMTFWKDMLYTGNTVTRYSSSPAPYVTGTITYRVAMNLDDAKNYTADVYFYNAKFADNPKAPTLNFVLKGLPLKFTSAGYEISVENVDPVMVPENTPNTAFPFTKFGLRSTSDLSGIVCSFEVAGRYQGDFSGNGLYLAK